MTWREWAIALAGTVIALVLAAVVFAQDLPILSPTGERIGIVRPNPTGYDFYDTSGQRLGRAERRLDGSFDLYAPDGRRELTIPDRQSTPSSRDRRRP